MLVAPEPDRQQPHDEDEVYVVLEGSGVLEVEGTATPLDEGMALFVPAGAEAPFHRVRAPVVARHLQRPALRLTIGLRFEVGTGTFCTADDPAGIGARIGARDYYFRYTPEI